MAPTIPPMASTENIEPYTIMSTESLFTVVLNLIKEQYNYLLDKFNMLKDALTRDELICIFKECRKNDENSAE